MKNMIINIRYIAAGLLLSLCAGLHARTFAKGEEIYVNARQNDVIGNWAKDGAKLYVYLFEDPKNEWIQLQHVNGDIFKAVIPHECTYSKVIVTRGSSPDWSGKWNQTEDMEIPEGWDCIDNFGDAMHRWKMYTPAAAKIGPYAATVPEEQIKVCPSALGTQFSLKAKLNSARTEYVYTDVTGHGWFSSADGTTWTSVDGYAGAVRNNECNKDTFALLPASLGAAGIYYFLFSTNPSGRRLIHITDDAPKCELDCEITSFETAISAVNADNNTFTLDGMVAFGEAEGKQLVIECEGISDTIDAPQSPQSFSLREVPAATMDGKKTTAKAYFIGGGANCAGTITISVPNSTEKVDIVRIYSHIGEAVTLTPKDIDPENMYVWTVNGDTIYDATQVLALDTFRQDTTLVYTYKEYYPAAGNMDDLMENGSYEDESPGTYGQYGKVSKISDYNFWGIHTQPGPINFYENEPAGVNADTLKDNGFAIVRNSNHFAPSYATVTARDSNNFALFDAVTGTKGGNKRAWYATTASNAKLKLVKGTTYVLSFWAANINNYGEMDNAARFVFRIEYNGKTWESKELDLSKEVFRNNIWHQHSETFFAPENCDNVTISVVNLNTNTLNIGNDFALDDIQFHPISTVSKVVKSEQQWIVNVHKPVAFTDTICEGESYTRNWFTVITPPVGDSLCINAIKDTLHLTTGDNHAMYSKWDDVLFISNEQGRYISFLWFKNGAAMPQETQQRYYDRAGMKGTTDTYYCRMGTTDGRTVITCLYTFDEVPRSAESHRNTDKPATIIRRYRISPHLEIIQMQTEEGILTQKILTTNEY